MKRVCHFCSEVEGTNLRISIPTTSREMIYSLPTVLESKRQIMMARAVEL